MGKTAPRPWLMLYPGHSASGSSALTKVSSPIAQGSGGHDSFQVPWLMVQFTEPVPNTDRAKSTRGWGCFLVSTQDHGQWAWLFRVQQGKRPGRKIRAGKFCALAFVNTSLSSLVCPFNTALLSSCSKVSEPLTWNTKFPHRNSCPWMAA